MSFRKIGISLLLSSVVLAACSTTTQMTSGANYLSRYQSATVSSSSEIDKQVRDIASIEPDLHFPARIGIARIARGQLTNAPADEMQSWANLSQKLGAPYGEFVPVSPLIATMVRPTSSQPAAEQVVADIRRASARQHLDYVLMYEVTQNTSNKGNALAFADWTILGLYVLPTRSLEIDSMASALLIDVRNGYPYGTATAFAERRTATTAFGSGRSNAKAKNSNQSKVVENLAGEVEIMVKDLWVQQSKQN